MPNDPPRGTSRTPPPRSTDRSRESEVDEKENRKRPHNKAEFCKSYGSTTAAAAPGSVGGGWHITTNSRCIVCGRLGDSCECRSTRMDPQLKRLKVDNFLQSTPHARCKQAKALEEIGRDEARQRNRLNEQWADGMKTMENAAFTGSGLLLLAHNESTAREFVSASERKEWAQGMSLADRSLVLVAVAQHERNARLLHYTFEQRQLQVLMDWHTAAKGFLVLLNREDAYRNVLISQEAAARAALESRDKELLNIMDAKERARRSMRESFLEQRDFIIAEWRRGVDAMTDAMADSERDISSKLTDRCRLCTECLQQKQHLRAVESEEWRRLRDAMAERGRLAAEALRFFAQQREDVARHEASARVGLFDEVTSAYSALFLARKREEEEVRDVEELKRQRRHSEECMALQHLSSIAQDEAAAFAAILALERREKDQRYRRMLEKAARLRELEHTCAHSHESLCDAEQRERHALNTAAQESEAAIGAWLQQRARRVRELVALAAEQERMIRAEEHEARFALVGRAAEHEQQSRQWADERRAQRAAAEASETESRAAAEAAEGAARQRIAWAAAEAAERLRAAWAYRAEARAALLRMALANCAAIAAEEQEAMSLLRACAAEDSARAAQFALHRVAVEVMHVEAAQRALVLQAEVRHRESAATLMLLERAVLEREAQERIATRLCELAASEQRQRELLAHAAHEAHGELCRGADCAVAEAQSRAEQRRREELRGRQLALAEDSRLYDAAEPLCAPSASAPREHCVEPGLQRALVLQALGVEPAAATTTTTTTATTTTTTTATTATTATTTTATTATTTTATTAAAVLESAALSPTAVAFLARVVDAVAQRGAAAREERSRAQSAADDAQRRVAGQLQALASAKERRQEGKEKLERDAAEHKKLVANNRAARQKHDEQLKTERARLQEREKKLLVIKKGIADLQEAIHSQHKKR